LAQEIERKFLVRGEDWRDLARGKAYRQGYLSAGPGVTVRVRTAGGRGLLTIKGPSVGATRAEYEYEIPLADANEMLDSLCARPLIDKQRCKIAHGGLVWEVDEFFGDNQGLIIAEVELDDEARQVVLPAWVGEEVTGDPRYYNANLVRHPYREWRDR